VNAANGGGTAPFVQTNRSDSISDHQFTLPGRFVEATVGLRYVVCWCIVADPLGDQVCEDPSDFLADSGFVHVQGPSTAQAASPFRCAPGSFCSIPEVAGVGLTTEDRLRIMETCGGNAVDGFYSADDYSAQSVSDTPTPTLSGTNFRYTWGPGAAGQQVQPVLAQPGSYKVCWCRMQMPEIDCTDAVHFLREVGGMEVPGSPTLHQIHLCVIGQSCDISIASSGMSGLAATRLLPIYLNDNDWLADEAAYTSSYCSAAGSSDVATLTPDPSTALGVVSAIAQPASGSLTSFSWGIAPIVNVDLSRQIILCWCGEKETQNSEGVCADGNSYRLIAGVLNIMGPLRVNNDMTCYKGLLCVVLNLHGAGLADGDVMVVSETLDCSGGP